MTVADFQSPVWKLRAACFVKPAVQSSNLSYFQEYEREEVK